LTVNKCHSTAQIKNQVDVTAKRRSCSLKYFFLATNKINLFIIGLIERNRWT